MASIEGEIVIGRPVDVVFDYVADQGNEPQYNPPGVEPAEKITPGPVRKGTRFRSAVASRGRTAEMLIECTGYDTQALFATTTAMPQADISYTLTFEPTAAGTGCGGRGGSGPGGFRLLGPVITWLGIRQEQRIWTSLKQHVGAGNCVTLCDLGILVDQATEPVATQNQDVRAWIRCMGTPGRRSLLQCAVRAVRIVVIGVLAEDQPQVPLAGDQHPVQALAAGAAHPALRDRIARGAGQAF